jgi:hypothetical protein
LPRFYNYKHEVDLVWTENKKRVEMELNFIYARIKNEILESLRQKYQESLDNGIVLELDHVDQEVLRRLMVEKTRNILEA